MKISEAISELHNACEYYEMVHDTGDEKQTEFQNILRAIGFEVKLKPFISRRDGSAKADWDVGITIDILEFLKHSDKIILASGDGDFDLLTINTNILEI